MRLEVFVPGPLYNPLRGSHGHWSKHSRWARDWRERTHQHLWLALRDHGSLPRTTSTGLGAYDAKIHKRVTFTAATGATWDDDNLRIGLKPVRDALKDAHLIDDDKPASGHTFIYQQVVDKKYRGVRIVVEW